MTTRVYISPDYRGEDKGDGGIRRVVEAQRQHLPEHDIEIVDSVKDCQVAAFHAGNWEDVPSGVMTVAHCHGLYWEGYRWPRWAEYLNKQVLRTIKQSDAVTSPSLWVAQAISRATWRRSEVMYHGINPDEWTRQDAPGEYVLWNKSRVDAICDPTPVVELAKRAPDVQFVTTYAEKEGGNVHVTGTLPYLEAKTAVQNAGVYLATTRETFGIGTLEAMVCGVPVLAWDWGGQTEVLIHKETGYLAKHGDYDDLLRGLRYCQANRSRLANAARADVLRDYTWARRIAPYAEMYRALAATSRVAPKVSVVVTYYNLPQFVEKAVQSAVDAAEYTTTEIMVVDDNSPAPLPPAVAAYPGVKIIRNEKNLYLSGALNVGIGAATGKYIIPLDADNMLPHGSIDILADALDNDAGLDIAYGKMRVTAGPNNANAGESFVSTWPPEEADLVQQLSQHNQIPSGAMFRKRVWATIGGYRRRCRTAEDADFWCRALQIGFIGKRVTSAVTLDYLNRDDSMSHTVPQWGWHEWYSSSLMRENRLYITGGDTIPPYEFPMVSVIIPVGNGHQGMVIDALDSIHNQSLKYWEAIVVDDTDGSVDMRLPAWAVVRRTKGSCGAATARNTGLLSVRGKYVLFLDADDWLHPTALDQMVTALEGAACCFAYSDWFVGETGEIKTTGEFNADDILRQMVFPVTCMYRMEDLHERGLRFDQSFDGKGWEDWDFALQAVVQQGLCGTRVPKPLFYYRYGGGTLREKAYANREELKREVYQKWEGYITGRETNLAKGCGCGGRPSVLRLGAKDSPNMQADSSIGDTVLLEYLPREEGRRTFIGRATSNRYRFDSDESGRVKRVYERDASAMIGTGMFRAYLGDVAAGEALLVSMGPPA